MYLYKHKEEIISVTENYQLIALVANKRIVKDILNVNFTYKSCWLKISCKRNELLITDITI